MSEVMKQKESSTYTNRMRYDVMGLLRFFVAIFVLLQHQYIIGATGEYLGFALWPWMDYYFILTGFFSAKHFKIEQDESYVSKNISKDVMAYTIKKFKGFMPYVVIAVAAQYLFELYIYVSTGHTAFGLRNLIVNMPYEMLCLSSAGFLEPRLAPIWYFSAMLIALPIVLYLMLKLKDVWYIFCWLIPVLYYGKNGVVLSRQWPNDMVKGFVCITLGTFVYLLAMHFSKVNITSKVIKLALTVCEIICWPAAAIITLLNKNMYILLILLWVVHSVIMFSGQSWTYQIKSKFFTYLGQLSLPMCLMHWVIGCVLHRYVNDYRVKVILYFGLTIIVSMILVWGTNKIRKMSKK